MKTILKVALGLMLGVVVLIAGCVAIIGAGVDKAQKDSDKTAITAQQYGSAKTGSATRKQIESEFGSPKTSDEIQAEGIKGIPESNFKQSCMYYTRKGALASLFQFCFGGDGVLRSKASY